ncbi:MAG TPA: hypothetical protein VGN32_03990, partial [Ktedonobacterales bacterium]|nr:hypothetical protein [Ktedonobacterales bacterium]
VDIRDAYPIVPLDVWARDRLHTSYWRLINLFARPLPVIAPLAYPDANDEFFGYLRRKTHLPDGHEQIGTRDLIRATGWAATALLALQAQTYVARKHDCHRLYRERIGGAWADLLAEIYARCRGVWHSTVPEAPEERRALRSICARTLGFENYFLGIYRDYLLVELASRTPEHRARAREMLAQVPWDDAALAAALCAAPG